MFATNRRRAAALFMLPAVVLAPIWVASACSGSSGPRANSPGSVSAPAASVPLFTQSSGASPIHFRWKAGACDVEIRDGLGATYRFAEGTDQRVESDIRNAADACLNAPKGTQGTMYVEAKVAASGALSDVVVSPGGAISTAVVACMNDSFGKTVLPSPRKAGSVLLLFVISACPPL